MPEEQENALKDREREILRLIAQGMTNREVGDALYISEETVRWYAKNIYAKLGVRNRTEAVNRAQEMGIIAPTAEESPQPLNVLVQYVNSGGVDIAYCVLGSGEHDIVFINGFMSHLDIVWEEPRLVRFLTALASMGRLILFDKRGVGLSDRSHGAPTIEETVQDAIAVMGAVGSKRAVIYGVSEGGAASVLMAVAHPERVEALVLYGATPKIVRTGDEPAWAMPVQYFEQSLAAMPHLWGGPYAIDLFAPSLKHDEQFRAWWSKILRTSSSPSAATEVFRIQQNLDVRDILPAVRVPTLILHRAGDQLIRVGAGRCFADNIPNAKYIELGGVDHLFWVHSEDFLKEVEQFIDGIDASNEPPETVLAAVVYAIPHNPQNLPYLREVFRSAAHASAISMAHTAQACIAAFSGPAQAISFAMSLRDLTAQAVSPSVPHSVPHAVQQFAPPSPEPLPVSMGIHIGECTIGDNAYGTHSANGTDEIRGAVVDHAELIALATPAGQVFITHTVLDLIGGYHTQIERRGKVSFIHTPQEMPVFEVISFKRR